MRSEINIKKKRRNRKTGSFTSNKYFTSAGMLGLNFILPLGKKLELHSGHGVRACDGKAG